MCLVSIVVPVYKGNKYLDRIVRMIENNFKLLLKENRNIKIELIIINDYPFEKLKIIESKIIFIRYIQNNKNEGIHASRVKGVTESRGDYILFLDQDDIIIDKYLKLQLSYINNNDFVVANGYWRGDKKIYDKKVDMKSFICMSGIQEDIFYIVSPGQVLIKKKSIPIEWEKYIMQCNGCDDLFLWILLLDREPQIGFNHEVIFTHIENNDNYSFDYANMEKSFVELYNLIKKFQLVSQVNIKIVLDFILRKRDKSYKYNQIIENWKNIIDNINMHYMKKRMSKIAIYGLGVIGKRLIKDLIEKEIEIDYIIDKNAIQYCDTKVYEIDEAHNEIDMIIITPVFQFDEIKLQLRKNLYVPIIPIDYFIDNSSDSTFFNESKKF